MRYLLITFYRKPNGQIDERVSMTKKIKPSDLQTCNVILDFADKKVDKCVIEGKMTSATYDGMVSYYRKVYPGLIDQLEKEAIISKNDKK